MADAPPNWFTTETTLLDELRRLRTPAPKPPDIPGYEGIVELRRGGQGVVYAATQKSTRRKVAIKVLLDSASGPASRRRFEREIDLVASLRHPRIVGVYDSGVTTDGRPFLVMEFVEGQSLDEYLKAKSWAGRPAIRAVVDLLARIAEAVEFAHQRGVIHRDLKPSNIRIDPAGEPRVLDFGLAKLEAGPPAEHTVSLSGQFLGSLAWASPEQAAGNIETLDVRSDVYSLGMMLYHALTGAFPYRVVGPLREVLDHIARDLPLKPSRHADWLDDEIETITLKCLAKEPERRYQSAGELARDLRRYLAGEPVLAKADSAWYTLRATIRHHRAAFTTAVLVTVGLLGASVALALLYTRARDAEQLAVQRADDATRARDEASRQSDEKAATAEFLRDMLATAAPGAQGRDVKVVEVLDRAARRLERPEGLSPAVVAVLRSTLADTYSSLGKYDAAIEQLLPVVEWRTQQLGEDHLDTLIARRTLGSLRAQVGKLDEGESIVRDVAERSQRLTPAERAKLNAHQSLGEVLFFKGQLPEAAAELKLALADQQAAPDAAPDKFPQVVASLGIVLRNQNRAAEAVQLLEQALESAHPQFTRKSGVLVKIINSLGSALHDVERFDDAERNYREALDMALEAFGEDHEDTIAIKSNLAQLYADLGMHAKAEPPLRETLEASRRTYGNENPTTLLVMNNYAKLLQNLGRLDDAEPIMRECYSGRLKVLGPEHPNTLIAQSNLANMMYERGQKDEALQIEKQILDIRLTKLGEKNLSTLISLNNVGMMTLKSGQPAEALPHLEQAARNAAETMGEDHYYAGLFRGNVARCLIKLDRAAEAEPLIRSSHQVLRAKLGDSDNRTRQAAGTVAEVLRALNRESEAAEFEAISQPTAK